MYFYKINIVSACGIQFQVPFSTQHGRCEEWAGGNEIEHEIDGDRLC